MNCLERLLSRLFVRCIGATVTACVLWYSCDVRAANTVDELHYAIWHDAWASAIRSVSLEESNLAPWFTRSLPILIDDDPTDGIKNARFLPRGTDEEPPPHNVIKIPIEYTRDEAVVAAAHEAFHAIQHHRDKKPNVAEDEFKIMPNIEHRVRYEAQYHDPNFGDLRAGSIKGRAFERWKQANGLKDPRELAQVGGKLPVWEPLPGLPRPTPQVAFP